MFDELMRAIQMPYEPDEARNQRNAQDIDFLKFMLLLVGISLLFSDVVPFLFYGEYSIRYIIITAVVLGLWKAWY
jgi:hypothetical protein